MGMGLNREEELVAHLVGLDGLWSIAAIAAVVYDNITSYERQIGHRQSMEVGVFADNCVHDLVRTTTMAQQIADGGRLR